MARWLCFIKLITNQFGDVEAKTTESPTLSPHSRLRKKKIDAANWLKKPWKGKALLIVGQREAPMFTVLGLFVLIIVIRFLVMNELIL